MAKREDNELSVLRKLEQSDAPGEVEVSRWLASVCQRVASPCSDYVRNPPVRGAAHALRAKRTRHSRFRAAHSDVMSCVMMMKFTQNFSSLRESMK